MNLSSEKCMEWICPHIFLTPRFTSYYLNFRAPPHFPRPSPEVLSDRSFKKMYLSHSALKDLAIIDPNFTQSMNLAQETWWQSGEIDDLSEEVHCKYIPRPSTPSHFQQHWKTFLALKNGCWRHLHPIPLISARTSNWKPWQAPRAHPV